ncbi:sulfur carrier protein ThiS [Shimia thalassica]|uniref:Sulfur carrier protein ThiS n=1 Tax=Shimia thalassica TaxID=1715693 RepID=A0A0P1ICC7_9RHOB|nr:sulfur carrier protein ThiS [Shimia thalassica]CUK05027.1 sulfur carrier protein ThiS [Shimia thalassica]
MQIIVNQNPRDIRSETLGEALTELGFTSTAIATAINGRFIPRDARADVILAEGDRLEVLAPMQGG